jgi:L-lactate utilization protein LutC
MTDPTRQTFLRQVQRAVRQGNRACSPAELPAPTPPMQRPGYHGGGPDLVQAFAAALQRAGGMPHLVSSLDQARDIVLQIVQQRDARKIALSEEALVQQLRAADLFPAGRYQLWSPALADSAGDPTAEVKDPLFAADLGITGADWLVAETGSVVVSSGPLRPRSISLLPPAHIVVAAAGQILPDLYDLFSRTEPAALPANLTIITGPSKTGDIEMTLVTGVHGPQALHVIVLV